MSYLHAKTSAGKFAPPAHHRLGRLAFCNMVSCRGRRAGRKVWASIGDCVSDPESNRRPSLRRPAAICGIWTGRPRFVWSGSRCPAQSRPRWPGRISLMNHLHWCYCQYWCWHWNDPRPGYCHWQMWQDLPSRHTTPAPSDPSLVVQPHFVFSSSIRQLDSDQISKGDRGSGLPRVSVDPPNLGLLEVASSPAARFPWSFVHVSRNTFAVLLVCPVYSLHLIYCT